MVELVYNSTRSQLQMFEKVCRSLSMIKFFWSTNIYYMDTNIDYFIPLALRVTSNCYTYGFKLRVGILPLVVLPPFFVIITWKME